LDPTSTILASSFWLILVAVLLVTNPVSAISVAIPARSHATISSSGLLAGPASSSIANRPAACVSQFGNVILVSFGGPGVFHDSGSIFGHLSNTGMSRSRDDGRN
jgi:hypothetical protein